MELIQGIETRRSIRGFKSDPVPDELIEKILRTAVKSPSYMNTQPWEVDVISGAKKEALSRILHAKASSDVPPNPDIPTQKVWPSALEKRFRDHAARRFAALGIDRSDEAQRNQQRMENFRFYGAPCLLIVSIDSTLSGWSIFDAGLFTQSLILAAHAYDLGTCLQASVVSYPDAIREFLGLPVEKKIIIGIAIGYPDLIAKLNSYHSLRTDINEMVRWHR